MNSNSAASCRFFNSPNGCSRGDQCQFTHEGSKTPCRFFLSSTGCRNGAKCPFEHSGTPPTPTVVVEPEQPITTRHLTGPFYAIDVECVATGISHLDRAVAHIVAIDQNEVIVFDSYVKPDIPVVSYLTPLTGVESHHLESAPSLSQATQALKQILPKNSIIIGQSIQKDMDWVGLKVPQDVAATFDVATLFRVRTFPPNETRPYRYYSLRHVAKHLMGDSIQEDEHNPVIDAIYAMRIFHRFRHVHENRSHLRSIRQSLRNTPKTESFAQRHRYIDGVALSA